MQIESFITLEAISGLEMPAVAPSEPSAQAVALKGVIAQVLCKKIGGGRVAAHEVLLGTQAVAALIREGKTFQIPSIMQTAKRQGMLTMNDGLMAHVKAKRVDPKEAWIKATDKTGLVSMMKGAGFQTNFTDEP